MTRFSQYSRARATLIASIFACALAWSFQAALFHRIPTAESHRHLGDWVIHRDIVLRVAHGQGYYDATFDALRACGYPTETVFNWRTPLYTYLLVLAGDADVARVVFLSFSVLATYFVVAPLRREHGTGASVMATTFLIGAFAWNRYPEPIFYHEFSAGLLILLSVSARETGWVLRFMLGIGALAIRELALPYCLVALLVALGKRRRREVLAWAVGLSLYALHFALHYATVAAKAGDHGGTMIRGWSNWITCGGIDFLLATCRMNVILMSLPVVGTSVYFVLSITGALGAAGKSTTATLIAFTMVVYLTTSLFIGQPYNYYWGWLFSPLMARGFALSVQPLMDLTERIVKGK
jgi:hypothetical protein